MTGTTYPEFGATTEAVEVARAFPDAIKGRTILVTGVNRDGIGFATVQAFASQSPANLILAGRNPQKVKDCIELLKQDHPDVGYRALQLDLSTQKAVRAAANELLSWTDIPTIDIVVNNAAIMNLPERQIGEDGIELTFATNHIGHYLFTCLIMPKICEAARRGTPGSTRIINVTSLSPTVGSMRWSDINFEKVNKDLPTAEQPPYHVHKMWGEVDPEDKSYLPLEAYSQSKVANVLFSIALNKRLYSKYGILSLACHPGIIKTELSRYASKEVLQAIGEMSKSGFIQYKTLGAGASTSVLTALDPNLTRPQPGDENVKENHGVYFIDCQISDRATPGASSSSEAEKLWALSENLVKETFSW